MPGKSSPASVPTAANGKLLEHRSSKSCLAVTPSLAVASVSLLTHSLPPQSTPSLIVAPLPKTHQSMRGGLASGSQFTVSTDVFLDHQKDWPRPVEVNREKDGGARQTDKQEDSLGFF